MKTNKFQTINSINYIVLILLLLSSSCCNSKNVTEKKSQNPSKENVQVVTPPTPESPKILEEIIEASETEVDSIEIISSETPEVNITEESVVVKVVESFNHSAFNEMLQKYVSPKGNVNYNGFKTDKTALRNYITSLGENTPNDTWKKEDKLAYWINAYNALTIDLILRNPGTKSIKDIDDPWDQAFWKLGDKYYDLNEIEHDILRKMNEPRIHFAIVCASVSCPKLQNTAFTASELDTQLTNATKEFLSDTSKNNLSVGKLKLSKIFKWFTKDFKQNQSLVDFLNKYSDIEISQNASISYKDYNWNLND